MYMITRKQVEQAVTGWQERYVVFLSEHAAQWRTWAEQSDSMVAGAEVRLEDVPDFFKPDYGWAEVVLDMSSQGEFNWNDPRIAELFAQAVQTPFYKMWGETIVGISLALADSAGIASLVEMGAGRGNLSAHMLASLQEKAMGQPVVITDTHETVLENLAGLQQKFPNRSIETVLWDVNNPAPKQVAGLSTPVLLYERASLTYANFAAVENLAQVADVMVLGDYFNYTGELFAYDRIFEKIGLKPLMYSDVKPILQSCFSDHMIVDLQVHETIALPNVSLIVAWK
jgi:hypothetical protein